MGADIVLAVDLNAVPHVLERFSDQQEPPSKQPPAAARAPLKDIPSAVTRLIEDTKRAVSDEIDKAKQRMNAQPHLFETAMAASDIVQMQIARARNMNCPPDILLTPDMRAAMPNAFDRADEFIEIGRQSVLAHADHLKRLLAG